MDMQTSIAAAQVPYRRASSTPPRLPVPTAGFREQLTGAIPVLRAFAISLSSRIDVADDLVQQTLMKAWSHQNSFEAGTNLRAWLCTILRNEYYSMVRKRRREVEDANDFYAGQLAVPAAQEDAIAINELHAALLKLPDEQREAILLIGAIGLSYDEAAATCLVPTGTVKSRVSRARARLKELLELGRSGRSSTPLCRQQTPLCSRSVPG